MPDPQQTEERIRLDKWLWAARFFKTRSQAAAAVKGGHVHLNGQRTKASAGLRVDDRLRITKGPVGFTVDVTGLSQTRGPAVQAQQLYTETAESRDAREAAAAERRAARARTPRHRGRPDKRQRRELRRFKQNG